jgi:putative transposase
MCSLYRNKYRIESIRYPDYDYSSPGKYFITICTKNKIPYFGKILNGRMILSETGIIVNDYWMAIPSHYPHITLDEYIIMPDHIHGIIIINPVQEPNLGASIESNSDTRSAEAPNLGASIESSSGKGNKNWKPELAESPVSIMDIKVID